MKKQLLKNRILIIFIYVFLWGMYTVYPSAYRDTVPLDSSIRYGKLPNGFTYYIKPTGDGSSEMQTFLFVKGGSAVQDPDQYDLQHFLEHVAFKAGKHMTMAKAHDLGFKLGQINGGTSFDFTNYYFNSVDTKEKRGIAFQLFQDIIWDIEFKDEYIDSERSVIINEAVERGRFSAQSFMVSLESTMMGRGAERPKDVVKYFKTFPYEALKRYYKDWYRPDLMAVMVVGDIEDVDAIEKEIKEKFSRTKQIENPRSPYKDSSYYRNLPPQFIRKENPYLSKGSKNQTVYIRLYMGRKEKKEEHGLEVLKNEQKKQLLISMLSNRLNEKQKNYLTAFNVLPKYLVPSSLGLTLRLNIEEGSVKEVMSNNIQLLKQLRVSGFSEQEFMKIKKEYLESLTKKDTTKVSYWADDIRDHFVYEKALPPNKKELLGRMMTDLTLSEFNQFIKQYIKTKPENIDIIMLAPPGHQALSYPESTMRGWISEANNLPVSPYNPPKIPSRLISPLIVQNLKVSTVQEKPVAIPGVTEYQLGNGVRVVLKSFDTTLSKNAKQQNKLSFHGFINRGINCYSKKDYYSALNATKIIWNSGVGGLDKFELERYFVDKKFSGTVFPYIDYDEAGIKGHVSLKDIETALQLVYLYFTVPNKESLAFEDWKLRASSSDVIKKINENNFKATIKSVLGDYTLYPNNDKVLEGVSKTDMNRAFDIYKDIYDNAEDFTFIFTGNFPEDKVLLLCRKYLGNLPVIRHQKKYCLNNTLSKQLTIPQPRTVSLTPTEFMKEIEVQLVYTSKITENWDWREEAKMLLFRQLMLPDIMQEMRFNSKDPGTYSIGVGCNPEKSRLFNVISIGFSCSSEDVDRLITEAKQFIKSFRDKKVDMKLFEKSVKDFSLDLEKEKSSRRYISRKIQDYYRYGRPWHSIEQEQAYIQSLSPEDIKNTAQRLLIGEPFYFRMGSTQIEQ